MSFFKKIKYAIIHVKYRETYYSIRILGIKIKLNRCLLFKFFDTLIPKNRKKILFYSYPDFSDNSLELYNYIKKTKKDYLLVWIYLDRKKKVPKNIHGNEFYCHTFKGIFHIFTSKYIVNTGLFLADICNFKKHILLQVWHGMPLKTLGFNEKGIPLRALKQYQYIGKYGYFFVSSDIFKLSMISCFLMLPTKVYITGQPKTDCVLRNRNIKKISTLLDLKQFDKVIIYAPTYKEGKRNNRKDIDKEFINIFYLDDYNKEQFHRFLIKYNILFIIKPHPFDEPFYENYKKTITDNHIRIFFDRDMKDNDLYFYDFFKISDLMITDFSSIAIDYLILKKPIIFLDSLSNEYQKNRGFILEDNYSLLMPGKKVTSFQNLLHEITDSLTIDTYKEKRLKDLSLLYKYFDNKSSERIVNIMENLK